MPKSSSLEDHFETLSDKIPINEQVRSDRKFRISLERVEEQRSNENESTRIPSSQNSLHLRSSMRSMEGEEAGSNLNSPSRCLASRAQNGDGSSLR